MSKNSNGKIGAIGEAKSRRKAGDAAPSQYEANVANSKAEIPAPPFSSNIVRLISVFTLFFAYFCEFFTSLAFSRVLLPNIAENFNYFAFPAKHFLFLPTRAPAGIALKTPPLNSRRAFSARALAPTSMSAAS
jgi:hypothetical protein